MKGTVYKSTGSWYTVKAESGEFFECRIKGRFRIEGIKSTNPIAVGDKVAFELDTDADEVTGVIHAIEPRQNYIIRKSVKLSKQTHILAANVDQVFLLVTLQHPITYTVFIDRFLVTCEAYDIPCVLLINKIDLYDKELQERAETWMEIYSNAGYNCLEISAKHNKNVAQVKELMTNKTIILAGNSGVGKSTLLNIIAPGLNVKTTEISEQHYQGQHTTTFAQMYDLDFGGRIMDTPGIRGFGLVDMEKEEIGDYFPELFQLKALCKFNNCLHMDEPKCAVKSAVESGEIAESRYHSYLQILTGEEDTYRQE